MSIIGMISGWYGPICYQFFFYVGSNSETEPSLLKTCWEFVDELKPYYALWLLMNERLLSQNRTEFGRRPVSISNMEALDEHIDSISIELIKAFELSLLSGKAFANFAVSVRNIEKLWKEQVICFTDLLRDFRHQEANADCDYVIQTDCGASSNPRQYCGRHSVSRTHKIGSLAGTLRFEVRTKAFTTQTAFLNGSNAAPTWVQAPIAPNLENEKSESVEKAAD